MRPRLDWLETFLAIAQTGSLTAAGDRVARSQSAVSLQLRQLEEVLDTRLFDRDTRHVTLTAAGERLLPIARQTLDCVDGAISIMGRQPKKILRVGVPEEYTERLVTELLATVNNSAHSVELACESSAELERRINQDQLDFAVALSDEVSITGRRICSDTVQWLEAPGTALSACRPLPVAVFDRTCSWRSKALESLEQADIDYRVVFTSASVAGVRAAIHAGMAVGVLARSTAGSDLQPVNANTLPPALAAAELVLIGNGEHSDAQSIIEGVRSALRG